MAPLVSVAAIARHSASFTGDDMSGAPYRRSDYAFSEVASSSFIAPLKPRIPSPSPLPSSPILRGPKISSAITNSTRSSGIPSLPSMFVVSLCEIQFVKNDLSQHIDEVTHRLIAYRSQQVPGLFVVLEGFEVQGAHRLIISAGFKVVELVEQLLVLAGVLDELAKLALARGLGFRGWKRVLH